MTAPGLVEFLLSRLAEDERDASAIANCQYYHGVESDAEDEVQRLSDPVRVLADVAAKRAVIDALDSLGAGTDLDYETRGSLSSQEDARYVILRDALRALVQPYSAHPGFDPGWLT